MPVRRFRLLDLYCCQGGLSSGYVDAGFEVVGVDISPQPRYPFEFVQADALHFLDRLIAEGHAFDAANASCPCQRYSDTQRLQQNDHPDLIGETRARLEALGIPYVIENVVGARAELHDPVLLCGEMFGLRTYRHRLIETNWPFTPPLHPQHVAPQTKMGRPIKVGEYGSFVGNFSGVALAREVMEMPWANRDGLREAVPPAYARYIGVQLRAHLASLG